MEAHAGRLLLATPQLVDPHFWRAVILMLQHDEEGTVGIVLNRPTPELVVDHLPEWVGGEIETQRVFYGGPVEPEMAIALGPGPGGEPTPLPGVALLDISTGPPSDLRRIRIYSGYAGWGAGQLEAEIAEGTWYLVQASPDDPFDRPEGQWARILRRQSGYLSLVSTFPDDVALN
ncbi:MAG TPA: YqgE/AlgH family protein [Acidimicrobiia bacterium]|nr:YqgE/AlgH family protein [Acidimicrobiia bacterium]